MRERYTQIGNKARDYRADNSTYPQRKPTSKNIVDVIVFEANAYTIVWMEWAMCRMTRLYLIVNAKENR